MYQNGKISMAQSSKRTIYMLPNMANRHGLIAGATGTGKTVTMKVMAESFSDMGVPVFMADVKGDLTGMCECGNMSGSIAERVEMFGITDFTAKSYPVRFWDLFGEQGHPVRVTVSSMGPTLLARLLDLTEVQTGVLNIVFRVADDNKLLLLDLKDLRSMLAYVAENRSEFTIEYGNVSTASIGAIQRALLAFEEEGGAGMFGETELDIRDFIRTDENGRGYVNILSSKRLIGSPLCYSTFLLWMLSDLYEKLPEVGDLAKPRFVFFFDEAHLLFNDAPKALVNKIVQIVKLIRSKGVGIYFVSQSPSDIPDEVLAQLSNRVQHALRAYTPGEQKTLRAVADGFRVNPEFNTIDVLTNLGVGEALVSFLDENGIPEVVEAATIYPPQSRIGEADETTITSTIISGEFEFKYRDTVDRESAYEILNAARIELAKVQQEAAEAEADEEVEASEAGPEAVPAPQEEPEKPASSNPLTAAMKGKSTKSAGTSRAAEFAKKSVQRAANSAASSVSRSVSTNIVNSIMGGKKVNAKTMTKRAATNALSSVMRSGASEILRGLFGNKK